MLHDERQFQRCFADWATTWQGTLASPLTDDIAWHLSHTDPQGYPLCFDGPLRAALFLRLHQWCDHQSQEVQRQMVPDLLAIEQLGSHAHFFPR